MSGAPACQTTYEEVCEDVDDVECTNVVDEICDITQEEKCETVQDRRCSVTYSKSCQVEIIIVNPNRVLITLFSNAAKQQSEVRRRGGCY